MADGFTTTSVFRQALLALACAGFCGARSALAATSASPEAIQFNRDIRPILSDSCFPCHGFDAGKRKANLRLDTEEGLRTILDGKPVIKAGDPDGSELWRRVSSGDAKVRMPPPEANKRLERPQIELLRGWIAQGAPYQEHWAFEPPVRPNPPPVKNQAWPRSDLDRFILAKLESRGLSPSPPANRETLIRRATLALTGLPPAPDEVDAFLADSSAEAYDRLVDRLLSSPGYGEHMARYWLDVARYGDTHGLHLDNERSMWPYRDWVVDAFNKNVPFNDFTIWQLAGDLLPKPSREQLVASGFNRCNVSTSEGGAIDEEFQVRYAVDRVETTSAVWMGLTMGCAVCHDHKLDPISQKEFYQMFSLFNNISENAMDGNALLPPPVLALPTAEQEKRTGELHAKRESLETRAREMATAITYVDPASLTDRPKPEPVETIWFDDDYPTKAEVSVNSGNDPSRWVTAAEAPVFSGARSLVRSGQGLHQVFFPKCGEPLKVSGITRLFVHVYVDSKAPPRAVMIQFHVEGWDHRANWGDPDAIPYGAKDTTQKVLKGPLPEAGKWVRLEVDAAAVGIKDGSEITGVAFTQFDGTAYWDKVGMVSVLDPAENPAVSFAAWEKTERALGDKSKASAETKKLLKLEAAKRDESQREQLRRYYLEQVYAEPGSEFASLRAELKQVREHQDKLEKEVVSTMISKELEKPRPAHVLIRGEYDRKGEAVGPGVPSVLPPLPEGPTTNRLTLAQWLTEPTHPLTARVTVNRFWQQLFGTGLVKTAEDFGSKGEWPSHPELLDWLATEFMRSGWDVKALVRLLVTSATFTQDSAVSPELARADPENRLLARGPRYRLDAEVIRDEALQLGGLLNPKNGGRGVRTYQPPGIWEAVGYTTSNTAKYSQDHGDALYRRSLYLFWKRTAPPPSMTTFDAPSRERCVARRERTNTPLQALLTLNDIQFFEAARHLGARMLQQGGSADAERLRFGFRLVTARYPTAQEAEILAKCLAAERNRYAGNPDAARQTVAVGESPLPTEVEPAELAAYTMVANLLLNLDEVVTLN